MLDDHGDRVWSVIDVSGFLVTGADAASYLHSQLSNDVVALDPADSCPSFVLEPTGRIDALVRVTRLSDDDDGHARFLIDTDGGDPAELLARLLRFRIRVRAEIVTTSVTAVAVRGTEARGAGVVEALQRDLGSAATGVEIVAAAAWWGDGTAVDVLITPAVPRESVVRSLADLSAVRAVTADEIERRRVACGWPSMGREIIAGETIPAATGVVARAVSFTKGCYPGQELVERMDSRGSNAPRSLRVVPTSVLGVVAPGDVVTIDGCDVGVVTSVAGDVALAYVSRSVALGSVVDGS